MLDTFLFVDGPVLGQIVRVIRALGALAAERARRPRRAPRLERRLALVRFVARFSFLPTAWVSEVFRLNVVIFNDDGALGSLLKSLALPLHVLQVRLRVDLGLEAWTLGLVRRNLQTRELLQTVGAANWMIAVLFMTIDVLGQIVVAAEVTWRWLFALVDMVIEIFPSWQLILAASAL